MQTIGRAPADDAAHDAATARAVRAARDLRRRRRLRALRRPVAALLLGLAAALGLLVLRPPSPPTTEVLVAATDLAAGHRLVTADLTTASLPVGAAPPSAVPATEGAAWAGAVLASPLGQGELVTPARTVGTGLLGAAPPGTLAVPVPVATALPDGALRAGERVAVLAGAVPDAPAGFGGAAPPRAGEVLVAGAAVLAAPTSADAGGLLSGAAPAGGSVSGASVSGTVAVLALTRREAEAVVGASTTRPLTLALVSPGARAGR